MRSRRWRLSRRRSSGMPRTSTCWRYQAKHLLSRWSHPPVSPFLVRKGEFYSGGHPRTPGMKNPAPLLRGFLMLRLSTQLSTSVLTQEHAYTQFTLPNPLPLSGEGTGRWRNLRNEVLAPAMPSVPLSTVWRHRLKQAHSLAQKLFTVRSITARQDLPELSQAPVAAQPSANLPQCGP